MSYDENVLNVNVSILKIQINIVITYYIGVVPLVYFSALAKVYQTYMEAYEGTRANLKYKL